jgi:hypothetical protein
MCVTVLDNRIWSTDVILTLFRVNLVFNLGLEVSILFHIANTAIYGYRAARTSSDELLESPILSSV